MLNISCPNCQKNYRIKPEFAGRPAQCTDCKTKFNIPIPVEPVQEPESESDPFAFLESSQSPPRQPPPYQTPPPAPSSTKVCPFCGEQILTVAIKCKHCGSSLLAAMPSDRGAYGRIEERYSPPSGIVVPLLISAIGNIFVSLIWLALCWTFFLAIPLIILCIFEFILYSQADSLPPKTLASRAGNIAVFELLVGLISTPALVCGIITMINANKLAKQAQYGRSPFA